MINLHDTEDTHARRDLSWRSRNPERMNGFISIYVEDANDVQLYERLLGASLSRWLIFVAPPGNDGRNGHKKGGFSAAQKAVAEHEGTDQEWYSPGLKRHYCLLDGEEASRCGFDGYDPEEGMVFRSWLSDPVVTRSAVPAPRTDRTSFDPNVPDEPRSWSPPRNDAVLLLNCHEMENLYFLHADACDLMLDTWGEERALYGSKLHVEDAWKVLHRCIMISFFSGVRSKYNIVSEEYGRLFGPLNKREVPLGNIPSLLLNCISRVVRSDLRDQAMDLLNLKLNWLKENENELRAFSPYALRICDGKTMLAHTELGHPRLARHFHKLLARNGFARDFQISLMFVLMRQVRYLEDPREIVFGRGPYALTAWSPSGFHP